MQRTARNAQRATHSAQRTSRKFQRTARIAQRANCNAQHTARILQRTAHRAQIATKNAHRASTTRKLQCTARNAQRANCNAQHTARKLQHKMKSAQVAIHSAQRTARNARCENRNAQRARALQTCVRENGKMAGWRMSIAPEGKRNRYDTTESISCASQLRSRVVRAARARRRAAAAGITWPGHFHGFTHDSHTDTVTHQSGVGACSDFVKSPL